MMHTQIDEDAIITAQIGLNPPNHYPTDKHYYATCERKVSGNLTKAAMKYFPTEAEAVAWLCDLISGRIDFNESHK